MKIVHLLSVKEPYENLFSGILKLELLKDSDVSGTVEGKNKSKRNSKLIMVSRFEGRGIKEGTILS